MTFIEPIVAMPPASCESCGSPQWIASVFIAADVSSWIVDGEPKAYWIRLCADCHSTEVPS